VNDLKGEGGEREGHGKRERSEREAERTSIQTSAMFHEIDY
jgi:hypothetical protein